MDLIYVDEDTLDWLNFHKSPMPMAEMERDIELGYAEFKCLVGYGLTLKQFHIALLYYFCGLKQCEIARIIRTSQPNVSQQIRKLKERIAKHLVNGL